jgi:hypothetical protein
MDDKDLIQATTTGGSPATWNHPLMYTRASMKATHDAIDMQCRLMLSSRWR